MSFMDEDIKEIEVVCAQCSFPTVSEYDDKGTVVGFREEPGPRSEEEALKEGWLDHGMGLYCPKCSLAVLEETAAGAGQANGDIGEIVDEAVMKSLVPEASDYSVREFVRMFRSERISKFRVLAGLPPINLYMPVPRTEEEAREMVAIGAALDAAGKRR
jgi:hypothetical protein